MKQNTIKMSCIALAISSVLTAQHAVAAAHHVADHLAAGARHAACMAARVAGVRREAGTAVERGVLPHTAGSRRVQHAGHVPRWCFGRAWDAEHVVRFDLRVCWGHRA